MSRRLQRHGRRFAVSECGQWARGPGYGVLEQHGRLHVEPGDFLPRICGAVVQQRWLRTGRLPISRLCG